MANPRNQPRPAVARRGGYSPNRGKRKNTKIGRKLFKLILVLALVGAAWKYWEIWSAAQEPGPLFPIAYVRVEGGIENLDLAKFQQAVLPIVSGGYFTLDTVELEGAVRSFAWIEGVRFTRVWSDTVEIFITEHKPVARWGDKALLNQRGERFAPDSIEAFSNLPVIYGPSGMEASLLEMLENLNDRLEPKGVSVASLDLSKRRAWVIKLSNGLEIHFGRQDPVQSLEQFLEWAPKLGEDGFSRLKRLDLRYTNGFAVVRKPAQEAGAGLEGESVTGSQN
jgi:cell division protein FtsQ